VLGLALFIRGLNRLQSGFAPQAPLALVGGAIYTSPTALTTAPVCRFGESKELGRTAPGLAADLIVLNRDTSEDVRAFGDVRYTPRQGKVIYRASSALQTTPAE